MGKLKICKNPACHRHFKPDKYNPKQAYCKRSACIRYRDNLRQKRHYRRHSSDKAWCERERLRKQREREKRRHSATTSEKKVFSYDSSSVKLEEFNNLKLQLFGLASFFSGSKGSLEVSEVMERCLIRGNELSGGGGIKKSEDFLTLA